MRDLYSSQKMTRFITASLFAMVMAVFVSCTSGSSSTTTPTTPTPTTTAATAASLQLSGSPTTIRSDGSTTSTITVTAISTKNSSVPGVTVTLSADTGLLNTQTVTTDATGKATATFSSGTANKATRIATITATAGTVSATLPVQIVGSTLTLTSTTTTVPATNLSPAILTITAKDAGGFVIPSTIVTLSQVGSGTVIFSPASGLTDVNGVLKVAVAGAIAGTTTVTAAAAGVTASANFTVGAGAATFGISQLTLNGGLAVVPVSPKTSAMQIGDSLAVQVTAPPPTANVTFATTIGVWNGGTSGNVTIPVAAGGIATATLTTSLAGAASVQVLDSAVSTLSDTLTVGMTAKTPAKISLQASPVVVPKSVGSTVGYSNLTALVSDATGAPVGNAPVAFSIVSGTGTGSGETVSPVVVFTTVTTTGPGGLALGTAPTTFTSGSLSSAQGGVQIRASVIGTAIATQPIGVTNNTTSSFDAAIVVGGTAGSVAFGQAANIIDAGTTSTIYSYPMSVLVADSNGSPAPLGTVVNISVWPIAWSTGSGCVIDANTATTGTFYNEDVNQNLILDAGEDGTRKYFTTGMTVTGGKLDGQITPLNSYGGTIASTNAKDLPGTATTDASGLATFNLTYTKSSALWIISRIHATAVVQGSPAVGQLDFRLLASAADVTPVCYLPPSPFKF